MKVGKALWLAVSVLTLATSTACSADDTEGDAALAADLTETRVDTQTTELRGSFVITNAGHTIKIGFSVTEIDWAAKTARWDTTIIDSGGHPTVGKDTDLPTTIKVDRCPGCFTFESTHDGDSFGIVRITDGRLDKLFYEGILASQATLDSATKGRPAEGDPTGACQEICGGQPRQCKNDVKKSACNSRLFGAPRCPQSFHFAAGERCHF